MKRLACGTCRRGGLHKTPTHITSRRQSVRAIATLTTSDPKRAIPPKRTETCLSQQRASSSWAVQKEHPKSVRETVVGLLSNIGSKQEVQQYLDRFKSVSSQQFAVIKVGGDILTNSLDQVCRAISNLYNLGLYPVIVHGGGPQLNQLLKEAGIQENWEEGIRITDLPTLKIAWKLFNEENTRFVQALDRHGVKAVPSLPGVLKADFLDKDKWGYVGKITEVNIKPIEAALGMDAIPVLTSMALSHEEQYLNVNADVAAAELARALKPLKIVYLSEKGGLFNTETNERISEINLDTQYESYMKQPWVKHGTKLKIKEMKQLLQTLPRTSTVAIIDPGNLEKELFTDTGAGTLIKRGMQPEIVSSVNHIRNIDKFKKAMGLGRGGGEADSAVEGYLQGLTQQKFTAFYFYENAEGVAIVHHPLQEGGPAFMSTFNISKAGWLNGLAEVILSSVMKKFPKLMFVTSPANEDYFNLFVEHAEGFKRRGDTALFWKGVDNIDEAAVIMMDFQQMGAKMFEEYLSVGSSEGHNAPPSGSSTSGFTTSQQARAYSTMVRPKMHSSSRPRLSTASVGLHASARNYSTATNPNPPFEKARNTTTEPSRVALIGARGYTGQALIELLDRHPLMDLRYVSSRELNGKPLEGYKKRDIVYQNLYPEDVEKMAEQGEVDCWVMALPNGVCAPFVEAVDAAVARSSKKKDQKPALVVDLSADFRFDSNWTYGLPEIVKRETIANATRISNPGCYATAAQLGIAPLLEHIGGQPTVFGVSGYSGAGTKPSPKNDVELLRDNLVAYSLTDHIHEKEVSKQLGTEVAFIPHVASWFQGIHHTISIPLRTSLTSREIRNLYQARYAGEPLVKVVGESPQVKNISGRHGVEIGGFAVHSSGKRVVVNVTIDNLLKGAATQCLQNMNLALGWAEFEGIVGNGDGNGGEGSAVGA